MILRDVCKFWNKHPEYRSTQIHNIRNLLLDDQFLSRAGWLNKDAAISAYVGYFIGIYGDSQVVRTKMSEEDKRKMAVGIEMVARHSHTKNK